MSDKWYYVKSGERVGPVEIDAVFDLLKSGQLNEEDYVWRKGLENWAQVKDMNEFESALHQPMPEPSLPPRMDETINRLQDLSSGIFVKIGVDRGGNEVEYGPYHLDLIKRLFDENRINGKTYVFSEGMSDWKLLADFEDFSDVFSDLPPPIEDEERRSNARKPFIARMYIENNQKVFVGICRDISTGGMQVLVDEFPGQVGETISINVHPENTDYHFVASGQIVRVLEGRQGFSFRFSNLSGESEQAIQSYLSNG
ncbi:MAG: hypothetical protein CME65_02220 [Halobacteriovoraceae bacterium]|nr:hypothetical protein [Halobacteriovoraceae bacterium]|tara:strand:+ start:8781 stop:9548 length:768 start_codon:yes stop_codon:yes gene_type:complete